MKSALCFGLLALLWGSIPATALGSAGTEGAAFLDIPVGARPAALGSAYGALATDSYAMTSNPGGLGSLQSTEVTAQHLDYLSSIHYESVSFVHPLAQGKGLGFSAQYLGSGNVTGRDNFGNATGDFSSHFGAYTVGYGQYVSPRLNLGITFQTVQAQLEDVSATAFAVSLGSLYRVTDHSRLSLVVDHLGTSLQFLNQKDSLPLAVRFGAAVEPTTHWTLAAEGNVPKSGPASGGLGLEWNPLRLFSLRAGYRTDTLRELSALAGLSVGMGIKVASFEFGYAWLPYGDLGNSQYFTLVARFGSGAKQADIALHPSKQKHWAAKSGSDADAEAESLTNLLNDSSSNVATSPKEKP